MDEYLWVWVDRHDPVSVLRVRGELDTVTADRFAAAAARELRHTTGPVMVDLSFLDFVDCAGARMLAAVLDSIPAWRLAGVSGIQPSVTRLLGLIGLDLAVSRAPGEVELSARGRELLEDARAAREQSREMLLNTSMIMARLATTYAEMAEARQRRATVEQARASRMMALSDTARDLSARYRQRAEAGARDRQHAAAGTR